MGSTFKKMGDVRDYTNPSASVAIAVDTVLIQPGEIGVAIDAIAASGVGSVSYSGVHTLAALTTDVWEDGDPLWWDATNVRLTRLGLPTLPFAGLAAGPKVTLAAVADVRLNDRGNLPEEMLHNTMVDTAVDLTLAAATHSGGVIRVTADAKTITLPIGVVGMEWTIVNACADGAALVTVDLNGNEIIAGANLTIAATKTANNTKATARRGDFIHLVCNVAATSWRCTKRRGVWVTD